MESLKKNSVPSARKVRSQPISAGEVRNISGSVSMGSLADSLGFAIRKAQLYAFQEFSRFMTEFNIRPAQFALLVLMAENPGLSQSAAGLALSIEKGNLTGLLLELQHAGLIRRKQLATDRRVFALHLTVKGKTLLERLLQRHEEYEQELASNLSRSDAGTLVALLKSLVAGPA